jgi:C_GCAxxG_C_C family probable redox protein
MKSKEDLLQEAYDLAFRYEAERGSCPQCVLAALMEAVGAGDAATIQALDGLAGGTALSGEGTCGALVGGLAAIGALAGRSYEDFAAGEKKRVVGEYAKALYDKFIGEYGSPVCKEVHKKLFGRTFNFWDPQDYEQFEKLGGHVDKCPVVTGNVARWAAEIIISMQKNRASSS